MEYFPKHFGGNRPDPETIKREGWRSQGTFVVSLSDKRLSWEEREFIRQVAERLYGGKHPEEDKQNDR